jgi:hypothetical protein
MSQGTSTLWALISPVGVVSISFDKKWLEEFYLTNILKNDQEVFKIVPFEVNLCNVFSHTATQLMPGLPTMDAWMLLDMIEDEAKRLKGSLHTDKTQFRMLRMMLIMFYIGGIYVDKDPFAILPEFIEEDNE